MSIPVTLLTGFLGSGKTTLVNRILGERHGERIGVIVNELGEVGIDGRLVVGARDDLVELSNGCICCTIVGDLSETVRRLVRPRLFRRRPRIERLLIEASGLASPGPALQTLLLDPEVAGLVRIDGVIALAHAGEIARQLEEHPEASEQLGYADRILMNHRDRCEGDQLLAAESAVRQCNAMAPLMRTERASLPIAELLDLGGAEAAIRAGSPPAAPASTRHSCGVGTLSLRADRPLDIHRLKIWLQFLAARRHHDLMRIKGVLRCASLETPVVVQAVYQWLEIGPGEGPAPEESVVVLIGRDLDHGEIERGWLSCFEAK